VVSAGRDAYVYSVEIDDGLFEHVSLLEPSWVAEHGLPFEAILGRIPDWSSAGVTPSGFRENPAFLRLLSKVIWQYVDEVDELRLEAALHGDGHLFLLDRRAGDPDGRVPEEDVVGTVEVRDGAVVAGSFQHNPRHRLFTARGLFRLPEVLEKRLDQETRAIRMLIFWPQGGRAL
jgi:hypothetical protein